MEELKVVNLTTGYRLKNEVKVVGKDLNNCIEPGTFVALMGSNGGGKSTLLRTLAGYLPPIAGEVWYGEKRLTELPPEEMSCMISVVLTERPEMPNTTVYEMVATGRQPYTGFWGKLGDEDKNIIEDCLNEVGVISLVNRGVNTLSDGEFQKVMIAKALAQQTPVIYLDEPTAFLDFPSKIAINRLLSRLAHNRNCIVVQSTHDLELSLRIADRIWLVDQSVGSDYGTVAQLAPMFDKYFGNDGVHFNTESLRFEW